MLITLISFIFSNLVSFFASLLFTGENYKYKWGLSDDKIFKPISNKRWKTFFIFFVGYSIIFLIFLIK